MKQIVCKCGRIAEVRRRANGKRLRYKHCGACGTSLGGIESAKILEAEERDDIGVFGEFADSSKVVPIQEAAPKKAESAEWVPDSETMPEITESEISEIPKEPEPKKPNNIIRVVGWGLAVVGVLGLGAGAYKLKNSSGGGV